MSFGVIMLMKVGERIGATSQPERIILFGSADTPLDDGTPSGAVTR